MEMPMRGDLVALDLETTGLDPKQDYIIEVGAVRIRDGHIIDEFTTMVNPGIPIPPTVTYLTGIQHADVQGAPIIDKVLPKIAEFVGDAPVIAHNITLDMGFLKDRYHILQKNISLDTYDLASVLLPNAARYNLNSLAVEVGVQLENAHRALDDARATALLYWALWEKLLTVPRQVVEHIVRLCDGIDWETADVFRSALAYVGDRDIRPQDEYAQTTYPKLQPNLSDNPKPIDTDTIERLIGENGTASQTLPNFTYRPQQAQMATAISEAFNHSEHLILEAGTGTGKSFAYLLPAVLWAIQNNEPVVISTNTINLQDQLLNDVIPLIKSALGIDFHATLMKGRNHYLSPTRLQAALQRRVTTPAEARTLAKILIWQLEPNTGDKSELNLRGADEQNVWTMVSADDGSPISACDDTEFDTPFCRARRQAEGAHILIVNHALLIADAKSQNQVLPSYRYLIVDEAHQLEDAITYSMTQRMDAVSLSRQLTFLGNASRGLLRDILNTVQTTSSESEYLKLEAFIGSVHEAVKDMTGHINQLFKHLGQFLEDVRGGRNDYLTLFRIERNHRNKASFGEVQASWHNLSEYFDVLINALKRLVRFLNKQSQSKSIAALIADVNISAENLTKHVALLNGLTLQPEANEIYWISQQQGAQSPSVHSAPLHIGGLMQTHLWNKKQSVILTSATLRTHDEFTFLQNRLGAEKVQAVNLGSPFDYRSSTLIYLPHDVPEPTDRKGYQHAIERCIIELAAALNGRVMVLFTSYSQLKQTAQAIIPRLTLGKINVYDQTDGTSRQALLDGFKADERAVLLGTKSFWEGVDIPGDSLSALVITRLPFAVPTDPIFSARAESYTDPFADYNLPDAVLTFRQGFGRLIRRHTDRGIVVVMDSRIRKKNYGSAFLDALPECTIQDGTLDNLPESAQKWLKMS
jgi:ATP-dependent DNA helicase DinG